MNSRVWPIVRKEFIQILRDRRTLAMVLLLPPMQILLLGYAVNSDVQHIRTVIVDQARDEQSREFVTALVNTTYFDVVGNAQSAKEAQTAIDSGSAKVAFVIPPALGADIKAGRPATVQMLVDGSDPSVALSANFASSAVIQARSADLIAQALERVTGSSRSKPILELRPNILYNPDMRSVNYMIPGLIGMVLQFQSLLLTSFAIVRERERGTLEQLIVTPIKPWELMLGKLLPFVLISFWNVGIASAVGLLWFRVEFSGSYLLLLALSLLFLVGSLGTGILVSTVSQTQAQAMQMSMFILLPALLLSGLLFPLENLPVPLNYLSYLLPLTYFTRVLRGITLKGIGMEYLWGDALILTVLGLVVFAISASRFQKKLG
jgi:ABC-2 type transport system permease protein